ncbi:MAG TPA: nitrilase-related carbon-nitrogen hydrolase, partial [Anaerolineales bacterium]|nr:nitrilase-related carbon-nitrogen hydrolase [Anaerolineales bacterium]
LNPLGTWGAWGFTQYGNLPLMQLASVTGMIGITFLMGWFVSVANWVWEHGGRVGETRRGLAIFGSVFLLVLAFGYARLSLAPIPATGATVRVAGITAQGLDAIGELMTAQDDASLTSPAAQVVLEDHWNAYFRETAREAAAGAKVIMWPEVSAVAVATDEESRVAQAQEVARQNGIYLALPMATVDPETQMFLENKVILIDPSGQIAFEHIKFGGAILESTRVGDGVLQSVDTPYGVLSAAICYDADYPTVIRQTGWNGVGLLLVPSRDWLAIDPVHTHMAVFRAVENGMSLVRQTDRGLSIAVDPYGRVLAQTDFFGATDRTLVAQVPAEHVTTAYTLGGVWLEWLAPLGFLGIAVWVVARRRRAGG